MSNLVDKVREMFNYNAFDTEEDMFDETDDIFEEDEFEDEPKGFFGRKQPKQLPSGNVKMVIIQPTEVSQAMDICDMLRNRKSIIINLEHLNKDDARRIIDITSGAASVLDGDIKKISNGIVLLAPSNYDIDTDIPDETKSKLASGWLNKSNA